MRVVIFGAGKAGRGFLGRLAALSNEEIIFIDKNAELVSAMQKAGKYKITFFDSDRKPVIVRQYRIYQPDYPGLARIIASADLILTCIYQNNLSQLIPLLGEAYGTGNGLPPVLVCENGIKPGKVLRENLPADAVIAEAVMLCTTCEDGINIFSQDYDFLPYDAGTLSLPEPIAGFYGITDFDEFCIRKNYTYNLLSAAAAYFGAERGYRYLSDAAGDPVVYEKMQLFQQIVDEVLSKEFRVPFDKQREFSSRAIAKFQNKNIVDTIERNACNARRKLGSSERIIGSMKLAQKYGLSCEPFVDLIASALRYGIVEGDIGDDSVSIRSLMTDYSKIDEAVTESVILRLKQKTFVKTIDK